MLIPSSRPVLHFHNLLRKYTVRMPEYSKNRLLGMWPTHSVRMSSDYLTQTLINRRKQTELSRILANRDESEELTNSLLHHYFSILKRKAKSHPYLSNVHTLRSLEDVIRKVYNKSFVLVSFDFEAYERNRHMITEIGLAVYDPGIQLHALVPNIKQVHLIVDEFQDKNNGQFVPDNKLKFLGGPSLTMTAEDCRSMVQVLLDFYGNELPARDPDIEGCILVGHGIQEDLKWMKQMNIDIPENVEILDTQTVWGYSHGSNGRSLTRILRYLDLPHAYLHNAGNDAYYTLLLALSICDPQTRISKRLDEHATLEPLADVYGSQSEETGNGKSGNHSRRRKKAISCEVCEPIEIGAYDALNYIFDNEPRKLLRTPQKDR